ncbi:MAG: hypothetical protein IIA73_02215, partial [Proteobacteria bacterium]|nr:hypothetical protein [Pseudomonadota bacterium]
MSRTALIRADGGRRLGMGHIKRCLALAAALADEGVSCTFACGGDDTAAELVAAAGYRPVPVAAGVEEEVARLPGAEVVVLDISHAGTFADAVGGHVAGLARRYAAVAVIDGLLHQCLVGRHDLPVDLAVIPYAAATEQPIASTRPRLLLGPEFFILDRAYAAFTAAPREIGGHGERVLVTAGGSDPAGLTVKALDAAQSLNERRLEIRIAIGPAFDPDSATAIAGAARRSRHRVTLLDRPESLARHMAWCDVAISASGLTKYELAATGTPALLLSIDRDHAAFNRPFEGFATARHLGVVEAVSAPSLAGALAELLDDAPSRAKMAAAGRAMLDTGGARRVATPVAGLAG